MVYELVRIPHIFTKDYKYFSLEEVDSFFNWFQSIKADRLRYLQMVAFGSEGELSKERFQALQYFMKDNIKVEKLSDEELAERKAKVPSHLATVVNHPDYKFVEPSFSICYDIAFYWGELIIATIDGAYWDIGKNTQMSDYGMPVILSPKGLTPFNPLWVLGMLLIKVYEGTAKEDHFTEIFNTRINSLMGVKVDYLAKIMKGKKIKYEEPGEGGKNEVIL
jgi:hypothetical protein